MAKLDFQSGIEAARQLFGEAGEEVFGQWQEKVNQSMGEANYYQAVLLTCIGDGIEDCKKRISISQIQKRRLDELSVEPLFAEPGFLVDYEIFNGFKIPKGHIPHLRDDKVTRLALRNPGALEALFETTDAMHESFFAIINGLKPIYDGEVINALSRSISSFVSDYDNGRQGGLREAKATMELIKRISRQTDTPSVANAIAQAAHLQRERTLKNFLELKLDRARELAGINPFFARTYMRYNVIIQSAIDRLNDRELYFPGLISNLEAVPGFVRKDDELYREMVGRFDVVEEKGPVARKIESNGNGHAKVESIAPVVVSPSPSQNLYDSIVGSHSREFSSDSSLRARYFAFEDALRYNANMQALEDSLGKFKLGKRLRGMHEVHVRNFFDDVVLDFLMKGRSPSVSDLETVYESCRA